MAALRGSVRRLVVDVCGVVCGVCCVLSDGLVTGLNGLVLRLVGRGKGIIKAPIVGASAGLYRCPCPVVRGDVRGSACPAWPGVACPVCYNCLSLVVGVSWECVQCG